MIRAVTKKPLHRTYSHESLGSALKIIPTGVSIRKASIYYEIGGGGGALNPAIFSFFENIFVQS
jgi:hypothetical protein